MRPCPNVAFPKQIHISSQKSETEGTGTPKTRREERAAKLTSCRLQWSSSTNLACQKVEHCKALPKARGRMLDESKGRVGPMTGANLAHPSRSLNKEFRVGGQSPEAIPTKCVQSKAKRKNATRRRATAFHRPGSARTNTRNGIQALSSFNHDQSPKCVEVITHNVTKNTRRRALCQWEEAQRSK